MIDKSKFENLYNSLSTAEVAKIYNINPSTVSKWARKLNIPRKCNKYIDLDNLLLSSLQMEVIIGSLLGDGCLEKIYKTGRQSRFTESHGLLQKDWLQWKCDVLNQWVSNFTYLKSRDRESFRLKSIVDPQFSELESHWYKRNQDGDYVLKKVGKRMHRIKILPADLQVTPLTLAVWYLDDGHKEKGNACSISTLCFTSTEVDRLITKIKLLGIDSCKKLKQGDGYIIRIGKKSFNEFINLIKYSIPNIPKCMEYKVKD